MISNLTNKAKSIVTLGEIDISTIKPLILGIPQKMWDIETSNRDNNFGCFHSTEHVLFKFHRSSTDCTRYVEKPLWRLWEDRLMPIMKLATQSYGYENGVFPKVMFAKLLAGGVIDAHIDAGPRNLQCHKIHVPIQTHEDIAFYIDGESYFLQEGFAYEVNNVVKHSVVNKSDIDRIHLIFEYYNLIA